MAKTKISEFSATPANNTDIDSINIAEGCSPSGINDAIRELMAQLKDFQTGAVGDSFNGPVGTTTAAAGAFTTLSASSTVSGTGFSTYLASPPAIGGTAAAAGSFTTLSASGAVTLSGGTANGVAYLNGSKVVTSGSALTFASNTLTSPNMAIAGVGNYLYFDTTSGAGANYIQTVNSFDMRLYCGRGSTSYIDVGTGGQQFGIGGSEQMRLTSTGLGIGTSSPNAKLGIVSDVSGGTDLESIENSNSGANTTKFAGIKFRGRDTVNSGKDSAYIRVYPADQDYVGSTLTFWTRGSDSLSSKMTLDSAGNLGVGFTPNTWYSTFKAFQFGGNGSSLFGRSENNMSSIGSNVYVNAAGNSTYINTNTASYFQQLNGAFQWYTAPSGTAGNAITFTQAMTLDASGNLGVGATSPAVKLDVLGSSTTQLRVQMSGQADLRLVADTGYAALSLDSNMPLLFRTNSIERARIDSSGNLLIGDTAQAFGEKFNVTAGAQNGVLLKNTAQGSNVGLIWNASTTGDAQFFAFATETSYTGRGSISYNRAGGSVAYNTASDYRAKDIIGSVTDSGSVIDSVPVYMGKMKGATQERPMFIAHETPSYAHTGEKDAVDADGNPVYQQMDASALIPVMWAEIQSLRKRLADAGIA